MKWRNTLGLRVKSQWKKYMSMTPEEKDKLAGDLKDKANKFKTEAENFAAKAKDYFEELKTKGGEALKEHMGDAEKTMSDLFGKKDKSATTPS